MMQQAKLKLVDADVEPGSARAERLLVVENVRNSRSAGAVEINIIEDLNFTVNRGEFLSIVGPSGCGKTTILLTLTGLISRIEGSVLFKGHDVRSPCVGMGIVFQDYSRSLFPWRSNLSNVLFAMRHLGGMTKAQKIEQATELLAAVGLGDFVRFYPWQLSGGMQQRVAIARSLASQSELLFLDEPLAAVDAQTRAEMQDLIRQLAVKFNQTCVLVTHDIDEAIYMADRVLVLAPRPTSVRCEILTALGPVRDQLSTREDPRFLAVRHEVMALIRGSKRAAPSAAQNVG